MSTPPGDQRQGSSTPPAPRGTTPTPPRPRRFGFGRNWILFLIGALLLNIYLGSRAMREPSRVRVPYSPFFLQQVRESKVKDITSKGTAIQGTFKEAETVPGLQADDRFRTEIPTFADNTSLSKLLQSKGVIVNAKPLDTGSPVVAEPPAVLRAHAPLRRAALLPHAPSRERAEHPRRVRAFAGSPISTVG